MQRVQSLAIDVLGTRQDVTIEGWFGANPSAQLADIVTRGGLRLDTAIPALVQSMASYAAANPNFNPVAASSMPTDTNIQNAINAAWHH